MSIEVPIRTSIMPFEDLHKKCSLSTYWCIECHYFELNFVFRSLCLSGSTLNVFPFSVSLPNCWCNLLEIVRSVTSFVYVGILCCRQALPTQKSFWSLEKDSQEHGRRNGHLRSEAKARLKPLRILLIQIHKYLLGDGYWNYVWGENAVTPKPTHRDLPSWEKAASQVLYCFSSCVHD